MSSLSVLLLSLLFSFLFIALQTSIAQEVKQTGSFDHEFNLPDLMTCFNGRKVKTKKTWFIKRRPEILNLFNNEMFGRVPEDLGISDVKIWEDLGDAFDGGAVRRQLSLIFRKLLKLSTCAKARVIPLPAKVSWR